VSYPRNAASPQRIAVGAVVQISDGAVQTSGVSITVIPQGGSGSAGGGTTAYQDGIVLYTPTQGETNYDSFAIIAYKTGCIPAATTVVTSASSTSGYAGVDWSKVTSATSTVGLTGTTIATSQQIASVSGAVGSVTGAVGSVTGNVGGSVASVVGNVGGNVSGSVGSISGVTFPGNFASLAITVGGAVTAGTVSDKTGYALSASGLASISAWTVNITGSLSGSVGSVTGAVGSVTSGVTVTTNNDKTGYSLTQAFPSNFASLGINASGHVSRVTLVDTTTSNTDMRGTDNAALASIWTSTVAGRIDATISSRSSHSAADVWSVATRTLSAFSFSVTVGTNNDKTGYSLATAPLDASGTAAAVWGALLSSYTTAGTFGGRVIRSDSSNVLVKLTGSAHIAADIHELQPAVIEASHFDLGAIDANALAADAASEIATSVWSAATRTLTAFSFPITVDAASIRSAIGMTSANLDTQLDAIPTAAEIDTQLTASHGAGSWAVGGTGSGAYTLTVTVNDGTSALQNATVRMVEGVNAFVGQTNASGVVSFSLDAATYSVAITKDGYSFTPTTKVVSATGSQTYSMTQITPTLPAAAGLSTGTAICYGTTGLPIAGVVVTIQQVDGKGTAGSAYDGDTFTLTSNAQGTITHNGFVRGAVYSIRRGIRGEAKSFTVPDAASFDLSEIVGRD
jgi:hypothetical protein